MFKFFICCSKENLEEEEEDKEPPEEPKRVTMTNKISQTPIIKIKKERKLGKQQSKESSKVFLYRDIEYICDGSFAKVFKGLNSFGNYVALKRVHRGHIYEIKKEIDLLRRFDHKNIIQLLEVFERGEYYYIVLPYYHIDLFDSIDNVIKKPYKIFKILLGIAEGLLYLHRKGYMHGDLKPENIMLDHCGNPVIIDFGLSKKIDMFNKMVYDRLSGTITYLPPEVITRCIYTEKMDIWSLGVIMYILMYGKEPFRCLTIRENLYLKDRITYNEPDYNFLNWKVGNDKVDVDTILYLKMLDLNRLMLQKDYNKRPDISSVIFRIKDILKDLKSCSIEKVKKMTHDDMIKHLKKWKTT